MYNQNSFYSSVNGEISNGQELLLAGNGLKLLFSDRMEDETVEEDEGSLMLQKWMHIAVSAEWSNSNKSTRISLYTNTALEKNRVLDNYAIIDNSAWDHFIGADADSAGNMANFFQGFIYGVCIHTVTKIDFTDFDPAPDCGDN